MNDEDETKEVSEENASDGYALYKFNLDDFLKKQKGDTDE
jgi:hypothetical protein